ncbi:MAG: response regulator [Actinobacteria bacterium]|nr:response regulator [Actinomycetota bacterium]
MTPEIAAADPPGPVSSPPEWLRWISTRGEMGAKVASFDWAGTRLGPITGWPAAARGAVVLCLGSLFPMTLRLGDELIVLYNDACREVFGPERFSAALGRRSDEVWPEADAESRALIEQVVTTGEPFFAVDRGVHLDRALPGEECYFTFSHSAIVEDDGRTSGVMSVVVESTWQVLADRRLRCLERLGREIVDSSTQTELAELAMAVLASNAADHPAGALFRATRSGDDVGAALASFGEPIDHDRAGALARACLADSAPHHDNGEDTAAARLHAYPVLEPETHTPTHVLVIRHHAARPWDAELDSYLTLLAISLAAALLTRTELWTERDRVARATALDAAKSQFFTGMSHELRTPLTLISAPVEDILARDLDDHTRADLALVQANVARLSRLVEAMLDFNRMEAGRLVPRLRRCDVTTLVRGLAATFAPTLERAGLEFVVDVPDLARPALVDHDVLERIVLNLLSNAVKFTPSGSVTLSLDSDDTGYAITVTDTGSGIDPDDHDRVFARFERLGPPSGTRAPVGAGIGLAMVRQLTELLGGTVALRSALGEGSTFTVRLPFEPPEPAGTGDSITPRRAPSFLAEFAEWTASAPASARTDRPRLLAVEDDAQLARFLADSLSDSYVVETAADGASALEAIRRDRPDVVLSDLAMPGVDGLELVRLIRDDPSLRGLPVLLLSARGSDDAAAAGLGEGADDYIAKPFTLVDLKARIAANLERARERSLDTAWRRAVMTAIHDGLVIFDAEGLVLEMNQAFSDLLGYTMADGPFRPPYPWWPTEEEDAEALAVITAAYEEARGGEDRTGEFEFYRRDRQPVWVESTGAQVRHRESGLTATVRTLRDISREHVARERRVAAAQVSADFSSIDELDTLLAVAEHGLGVLFDGGSTVQLNLDETHQLLLSGGVTVTAESLPEQVRAGLAGDPGSEARGRRPGILLVPRSSASGVRAWVQFLRPRAIGPDEMIVADLLAQSLALAVDRVISAQRAADREANLQAAMESHRLVGQAIGILVERHRLMPAQAFQRLRAASQNRNLKLREVARRVIETGVEPEEA